MSPLIILISVVILILYLILVLFFITGWNRIPMYVKSSNKVEIKTSVIVVCKNEELNLSILLNALYLQTYEDYELILVNDHSTDSTKQIMLSAKRKFNNLIIIDSVESGKKNALKVGILKATGDLIITTDADCEPTNEWIENIINFQSTTYCDLIIGPVVINSDNTFFEKLQKLEFATLIGSGGGAAGIGMPFMCNGANLAFTKDAWLSSTSDLHNEEISGDDVFLLHSIKKRKGKIAFLKSSEAMVSTNSVKTLKSFINQRKRWTSKSKKYTDIHIIITALVVFTICFIEVFLFTTSFFEAQYFKLLVFVFGIKLIVDTLFLNQISKFFKLGNYTKYALVLSIVYPFYIVYSAISGLLVKNTKWK